MVRVSLIKKIKTVQGFKAWEELARGYLWEGHSSQRDKLEQRPYNRDVSCMFKEQSGSQCSWNRLNKRIIKGDKIRGNGGESKKQLQFFFV